MNYKKLIATLAIASLLVPTGVAYAGPGQGNNGQGRGNYVSATDDQQGEVEPGREEKEVQERKGDNAQDKGLRLEEKERLREETRLMTGDQSCYPFQGRIRIKNQELKFEVPPVIKEGRTLIPVRAVTEGLGATVDWDKDTNTVTITKGDITVVLIPGSMEVTVNGEKVKLEAPAMLISNRTFVPLRFLGEIFKNKVNYNQDTGDIDIEEGEAATPPSSSTGTTTPAPSTETTTETSPATT